MRARRTASLQPDRMALPERWLCLRRTEYRRHRNHPYKGLVSPCYFTGTPGCTRWMDAEMHVGTPDLAATKGTAVQLRLWELQFSGPRTSNPVHATIRGCIIVAAGAGVHKQIAPEGSMGRFEALSRERPMPEPSTMSAGVIPFTCCQPSSHLVHAMKILGAIPTGVQAGLLCVRGCHRPVLRSLD